MLPALPCDIDDRYTLTAELGRGSHAIVYRALDRHLDREVAVKLLREELLGSAVSERFQREIRLTSKLEHPHIAHVYGTGQFMGTPYFVIALARGTTLGERLTHEHQLPVAEALTIARQLAGALQHAHTAGIIHRDVKPENILLTPDGALLTDFGVARALGATPGTLATSTGTAVGTLLYMSPEQLCAEKDVDARSDQYALALVLYEMLAGVPAHVAANAEGLRGLRIIGQHAPVRAHRPTVPEHVEHALQQALAPAPADRFTSMSTFIAALDGGRSSASYRISSATTAVRQVGTPARTRRWLVGGVALVAVAAGALGATRFRDPADAATLMPAGMATRFTVLAEGDTAVAHALATELGLWSAEIRAAVAPADAAASGVVLTTRVTPLPVGVHASVQIRPVGAPAWAEARVVQVILPASGTPRADSLRLLAARVLMATQVSPDSVELPDAVVDHPMAALRSYGEGWVALHAGDLAQAEQAFADASRSGSLPQAALWRATVASWRQPMAPGGWRDAAAAAQSAVAVLPRRDSLLAEALLHRANDRMPESCDAYTRATRIAGGSFAAWYGLGECLRVDSIVVLDTASPTGARFRTSRWGAETAYEQAIDRLPAAGLVKLFAPLPKITLALNGTKRSGQLQQIGGTNHAGLPALSGDTVVVWPSPLLAADAALTVPLTYQTAVRRLRTRLRKLTESLSRRAPQSVAAQLAYAGALEYAGVLRATSGPSALGVLNAALPVARTPSDSASIRIAILRQHLRLADFAAASTVSSQLLQYADRAIAGEAERLAPVALLTGRTALAESLLVRSIEVSPENGDGLPLAVATAVAQFRIASALGACESLGRLRAAAVDGLRNHFSQSERTAAEAQLLHPADWSRLTCAGAPTPRDAPAADKLVRARQALQRGDMTGAARILQSMREGRAGASAGSVAWDTRFAEMALLLQARDTVGTLATLVTALEGFDATMDYALLNLEQSAGLRRSLALCDSLRVRLPTLQGPGAVCHAAQVQWQTRNSR